MDRNEIGITTINSVSGSLSARRAWIEIVKSTPEDAKRWVALRKESVDRNGMYPLMYRPKYGVALRKESVDRNNVQKVIGGIRP